ncbi:MAG: UDP-N-acetylmuramoyl-L-alanine--D-glutamate ligase, partial [Eggerthellaceae bacterium]|nr:UDP-N-acetylmuramoyl-L-alanine--D-glutamate ligase [Eggerthellaceae bacterium]
MRESMSLGNTKGASAYLGAVLIIGLGRSGKACTNYCLSLLNHRISSLTIYAGPADPETVEWARHAEEAGATIIFDEEDITGFYDLCIASPGISEYSAFYRQSAAASDEIISEVEFAWRESAADSVWVAVTGTNGKTTTTSLIAHILDQAGRRACAVGNIGDTCIDAVASGDFDIYVAETSSFQLASTTKFAPNVAIVLNITQDHLKWHKSYEGYIEAKWKILDNLPEVNGSCAILNAINDEVRKKIKEIRDDEGRGYSYIPIGAASGIEADMRKLCGSVNAAFEDDLGWLCVGLGPATERICPRNEFEPMGEHNVINALAASSACLVLGLTPHEIAEGRQTFGPLEH